MKLFSESVDQKLLVEQTEENNEPEYYLEGVFLQANIKNRNGRIYPMEVMKPEVERYIREYVDTHRAFGELQHSNSCEINLEKVSHVIEKIWQDGDYFKARAKILDTPCGRVVKAMIKEGCQLGVSSRALGSVTHKNGADIVGKDFHLVTAADIVFEPSAQTAFPRGIIQEDVEWELDPITGEYTPHIQKLEEQQTKPIEDIEEDKEQQCSKSEKASIEQNEQKDKKDDKQIEEQLTILQKQTFFDLMNKLI